jgi:hypothetical protein
MTQISSKFSPQCSVVDSTGEIDAISPVVTIGQKPATFQTYSRKEVRMRFQDFSFGSMRIDGITHEHDVVIESREGPQAKEKGIQEVPRHFWTYAALSRGGHSLEMPSAGRRHRGLRGIAGDGRGETGSRPTQSRMVIVPTAKAIETLNQDPEKTNAILHVTC